MKKTTLLFLFLTVFVFKTQAQVTLLKTNILDSNDCKNAGSVNFRNDAFTEVNYIPNINQSKKRFSFQIKVNNKIALPEAISKDDIIEIDNINDASSFNVLGVESKTFRSAKDANGIDGCNKKLTSLKEIRFVIEYTGNYIHNETKTAVLKILKSDTANDIPNITFNVTGVDKTLSQNTSSILDLAIHPNPVNNELNISTDATIENVQILDMTGKQVSLTNISSNQGKINTSNISSGIYILKATIDGNVITKKIVKN